MSDKPDLMTTQGVLDWLYTAADVEYPGPWDKDTRKTAAYLAECVRLRKRLEEWEQFFAQHVDGTDAGDYSNAQMGAQRQLLATLREAVTGNHQA